MFLISDALLIRLISTSSVERLEDMFYQHHNNLENFGILFQDVQNATGSFRRKIGTLLRIIVLLQCLFCLEFQSSAGESAAATVGVSGPTGHLSRSEPAVAATGSAGVGAASTHSRLVQTAPGALTHPLTGVYKQQYRVSTLHCLASLGDL